MQKKSDENGKVLKFPAQNKQPEQVAEKMSQPSMDQKKLIVSASLVTILALATVMNSNLMNSKSSAHTVAGRGLASVSSEAAPKTVEWEHDLAETLSQGQRRDLASVGRTPSAEENLRYGLLGGGQYMFRFHSGKIKEIEFSQQAGSVEEPKYISSRQQFLNKYRSILPVKFEAAVERSSNKTKDQTTETYALVKGKASMANVTFTMDRHGRLLSMKVIDTVAN